MAIISCGRRPANRTVVIAALAVSSLLPLAGCAVSPPSASATLVVMKSGARRGHRGVAPGAANNTATGQTGQ